MSAAVLLAAPESIPWHDAALYWFCVRWADDHDLTIALRCQINAEESRQPLFDLGVHSAMVDVEFRDVWEVAFSGIGDYSHREVILEWTAIHPSPLLAQLDARRSVDGTPNLQGVTHHRISCSAGTTADIICGQVWIRQGS